MDYQYYYSVDSRHLAPIKSTFRNNYGVNDCLKEDPDALISRKYFVKMTEFRSNYVF